MSRKKRRTLDNLARQSIALAKARALQPVRRVPMLFYNPEDAVRHYGRSVMFKLVRHDDHRLAYGGKKEDWDPWVPFDHGLVYTLDEAVFIETHGLHYDTTVWWPVGWRIAFKEEEL
jgi:hypothetical protein